MATQADIPTSAEQGSQAAPKAHDDCAITPPSVEFPIPILSNDGAGMPSLLRYSAVEGKLHFNADGEALYTATGQSSKKLSFHYQAEYDGVPHDPAEVFVLVSGEEPLSDLVGRDDVRLAKACSEGKAIKHEDDRHQSRGHPCLHSVQGITSRSTWISWPVRRSISAFQLCTPGRPSRSMAGSTCSIRRASSS